MFDSPAARGYNMDMKFILDFDRMAYDTDRLLADVISDVTHGGICSEEAYRMLYKEWSAHARAIAQVASLPEARQKQMVSWLEGFVPFLADSIEKNGNREVLLSELRAIHEKGLSFDYLYPEVRELLSQMPREDRHILTAGGELDQWLKFRATRITDLVPEDHIAIVSAKTPEAFQAAYEMWGIRESDIVMHVNDRFDELRYGRQAHEKTLSVWATWAHPENATAPAVLPDVVIASSIHECKDLLNHVAGRVEVLHRPSVEIG